MRTSTRITRWILGCTAFGLVAFATAPASAATMTVNGYTLGEQVTVGGVARRGTVWTAEFDVTYDGSKGYSYCVDIGQDIGLGSTTGWETRAVTSSESLIRAAWLVDTFRPAFGAMATPGTETFAMGGTSRTTMIAALQVAVWEVMGDTAGSYDLYRGAFSVDSGGTSAGVMNLARTFLGALEAQIPNGLAADATWAYSTSRQDQVVVNPIPEPSSMLLFAIGAGVVGLSAAKRKRV